MDERGVRSPHRILAPGPFTARLLLPSTRPAPPRAGRLAMGKGAGRVRGLWKWLKEQEPAYVTPRLVSYPELLDDRRYTTLYSASLQGVVAMDEGGRWWRDRWYLVVCSRCGEPDLELRPKGACIECHGTAIHLIPLDLDIIRMFSECKYCHHQWRARGVWNRDVSEPDWVPEVDWENCPECGSNNVRRIRYAIRGGGALKATR